MITRILTLTTLLLLAGCPESIPFSGGELGGTVSPAPTDWTDVAQAQVVRLETRPEDPYSVRLWVIGMGPLLYVHAGANRTTWVENIESNPNVRLQIGETLYELRAVRVEDADEFVTFADAYETKYGHRPSNEDVSEAYLFRLEPRV